MAENLEGMSTMNKEEVTTQHGQHREPLIAAITELLQRASVRDLAVILQFSKATIG